MEFTLKPVQSKHCCSQQELDSALKSIRSKRNILVFGPEKIGKSSFLFQLKDRLSQSRSFTPVLFSSGNRTSIESYIQRNLIGMLRSFKDMFPDPEALVSASLLELDSIVSGLKIGDSAKQCLKLLLVFGNDPKIQLEDAVRHLFAFPSLLARESRTAPVVIVDDADLLHTIKSGSTSLSMFFDLQAGLDDSIFVLASSRQLQLEGFEGICLKPLSIDHTRDLLSSCGLELDEKSLTVLFNFAGGIPFYINYLGRLLEYAGKHDAHSISRVIDESLSNELHVYFSEKLKSLSPKELPILFCMAEHKVNTPSRISRILSYSQTNVRRFLSIMEEKGFVSNPERGVFEIQDPVFRKWLEVQSRS